MKPRIRRQYSILVDKFVWFCSGGGLLAFADTPKDAYKFWMQRTCGLQPKQGEQK